MLALARLKTTAASTEPPPRVEGVLVEMDGGGGHPSSGSGVRWGRLVVTHGCLLPPGSTDLAEGPLAALRRPPVGRPRVITEAGTLRARVRAAWRCPLLAASVRQMLGRGWTFVSPKQQDMAQLVVLQVGDGDDISVDQIREHLGELLRHHVALPHAGQQVLLESTPFGAGNFFLNSWTRGIVNKVTGAEGCLILSDAHAAPGSEGGGLYCMDEGRQKLVGLVVQTLVQVRGEAVSLCLCASAKSVLAAALDIKLPLSRHPAAPGNAALVSRGVALLRNGNSWASAVALDAKKGIFLTCAHVLKDAKNNCVQLEWLSSDGPQTADILYKCSPTSAFDVAILKTDVPGPKEICKISQAIPSKGEMVTVVGYGLLSPPGPGELLHGPLVSRGCVSQSRPSMLQTSCAVHCGNSGGAVLRDAELVGLVVGHTEITTAANVPKSWPRINFAVPLAAIADPIEKFLTTADLKELDRLDNFDPVARSLWTLNSIPNSKL